jgi:hypothetical protein
MTLVTFFTATLVFSIGGIVVLLAAKRFEMKTGKVFLGGVRPRVGAYFHTALVAVERVLPALVSRTLKRVTNGFSWLMHNGTARGVLILERMLEKTLAGVRYATSHPPVASAGKASAFLQEVAEHKKNLLKRAEPPRVVTE